jgi:hypothetical protein
MVEDGDDHYSSRPQTAAKLVQYFLNVSAIVYDLTQDDAIVGVVRFPHLDVRADGALIPLKVRALKRNGGNIQSRVHGDGIG